MAGTTPYPDKAREQAAVAAIVFTTGADPDLVLSDAVKRMRQQGLRIGGVLQRQGATLSDGRDEMLLEDIGTGQLVSISQNLGCGAEGCRLDPAGLARAAALVDASLKEGIDVLFLNRFGKAETLGGGLLDMLASAAASGIPVIVAVNRVHFDQWQAFAADHARILPLDAEAIADWCVELASASLGERPEVQRPLQHAS